LSKSLLVDVVVEETVVSSVVDAAFAAVDVAARLAVTKKLPPRVVVEIEFLLLRDDGDARIAIEEACLPEEDTPRDAAIARRDANVREEEEEELPVAVDIFLSILPRCVFVDMLLLLCMCVYLERLLRSTSRNAKTQKWREACDMNLCSAASSGVLRLFSWPRIFFFFEGFQSAFLPSSLWQDIQTNARNTENISRNQTHQISFWRFFLRAAAAAAAAAEEEGGGSSRTKKGRALLSVREETGTI